MIRHRAASAVFPAAVLAAAVLAPSFLGTTPAAAQFPARASGCAWQEGYHVPGLATPRQGTPAVKATVTSAAIFNDGSGPALFAGGSFQTADDQLISYLAKWTGSGWQAVPGSDPARGAVKAMAAYADGGGASLFVGREAGLDRWNGTTWTTIPFVSNVYSFAVGNIGSGNSLYASGTFVDGGGNPVASVARWNGVSFIPLGSAPEIGGALAIWNDGGGNRLYAGGSFATVGATTYNHLAKWTGAAWAPVGGGVDVNGFVGSLLAFGSKLYVGGAFGSVGGGVAGTASVAAWNGSSWESLGGGFVDPNGVVDTLIVHNDGGGNAVYAGGAFFASNGAPVSLIGKWNGSAWSAVGGGVDGRVVQLLSTEGPALIAAGTFTKAGGGVANNLARFSGGAWSPYTAKPGGRGIEGDVNHLALHDDGSGEALYASGFFHVPGDSGFTTLAKLDAAGWTPVATGSQGRWALSSFDAGDGPALYVSSGTATTVNFWNIDRLKEGVWTRLPGGFPRINAMLPFDDGGGEQLYFASFGAMGGSPFTSSIARYDGANWSEVGDGLEGDVKALVAFDDGNGPALYAAGNIPETAGSPATPIGHIAKWNGTSWTSVGGGMNNWVEELAVWNGALYASGRFTTAGGSPALGIAKWNGTAWSQVGGGITNGGSVDSLAVFDDGAGSALYVSGYFGENGAPSNSHLARWDGAAWTTVGEGANGEMQVYDDGSGAALYVAGGFIDAGGVPSYRIAQFCRPGVFSDGFESGFTGAWSQTLP